MNGNTIKVGGNGFGHHGPTVAVFDDFEKGSDGKVTAIGPGSAQVGTWDTIADILVPKYSNAFAHSGSLSNMSDWSDHGAHEGGRWIGKMLPGGVTDIYFSWWAYVPVNRAIPGANTPWGPNWKLFWIYHHPWPASDYVFTLMTDSLPVGNPPRADYFLMAAADDRNAPMRANFDTRYGPSTFIKGRWNRWEVYMKGSTSNGTLQAWEMNGGVKRTQIASRNGVVTIHAGELWDNLHFPGYGRGDKNSQTYYDDIYVATGPGAMARVEIGNAAKYTECTNLAVITPTFWSDTTIEATVRQGSFRVGEAAFIFVLDVNGTPNTRGYPIFIGHRVGLPTSPNAVPEKP
ncbi:MAG TPA: hypothetical protein PK384_00780 [Candidatus Latescibacteria bacterium]|nr:hypothetical protein [Candidatus Latescibacterota bacterium]